MDVTTRARLTAHVGFLATLLLPSIVRAEEASVRPLAPTVVTLRLGLPLTGYDGAVRLESLSASGRILNLVEAEVGETYSVSCVHGISLTGRTGVSLSAVEPSAHMRWNLRTPLLLGYTYAPMTGGGCDQNPDERIQSWTVALGLDATIWGSRAGFNMRLLSFVGTATIEPVNTRFEEETTRAFVYGMTFDIGLALPIF
jgi:hypothetical protein